MDEHDTPKQSADAEQRAVELMEAAAYSRGREGRLWRLEWAQAFKRLAEMAKKREDNGPN
jgi:hypothetical protein